MSEANYQSGNKAIYISMQVPNPKAIDVTVLENLSSKNFIRYRLEEEGGKRFTTPNKSKNLSEKSEIWRLFKPS